MKSSFQLSLLSLLPVSAAAFYLDPVLKKSKARVKFSSRMPTDDFQSDGKITYPKLEFPVKEPDMDRTKVRRDCALICYGWASSQLLLVDTEKWPE